MKRYWTHPKPAGILKIDRVFVTPIGWRPSERGEIEMTSMWMGIRLSVRWLCPLLLGGLCCGLSGLSQAADDPMEIVVSPEDDLAAALERVPEGGRIVLTSGIHRPESRLGLERAGVTLTGEPGAELQIRKDFRGDALLTVRADGVRIIGLVFDGGFAATRAIRSEKTTRDLRIEKCEVRYWGKHGIDLDGADQLVLNCHIHHCLSKAEGIRTDAHGVVTLHAKGLRIEGCQISNCSGDSVQADRGTWQNVEIVDCDMSLEPLAESMGGFDAGDRVGENAFDSKREANLPRGKVLIEKCRMWGFQGSTQTGNWAALNLKENVAVTVRGCSMEGSRIGVRLAAVRRWSPLIVQMEDCSVSNCDVGVRFEDLREGPEAPVPELSLEDCRIEDCKLHVQFFGYKFAPGQGSWQPPKGVHISNCKFAPKLRIGLGTNQPKLLQEAARYLVQFGENQELSPSPAAAGSNDTASRETPGRRVSAGDAEAANDSGPVCPRDEGHRGKIYRRAGGKLHCRCPACGALWTLPDNAAKPSPATPAGTPAPAADKGAPGTKPVATGGKAVAPVPK